MTVCQDTQRIHLCLTARPLRGDLEAWRPSSGMGISGGLRTRTHDGKVRADFRASSLTIRPLRGIQFVAKWFRALRAGHSYRWFQRAVGVWFD
ncbi:hypothetical protein PoB_007514300 [Plakobranchus ocellatus]|uniref:Uncharacterized protein n=1 Tax=Plakobranchus ocellatus TaxID=259542 RepID=A0AAV4DX08_9GAST|nr:hypothetical protein PoB_007514300 [Plakobranchus ocellatus]